MDLNNLILFFILISFSLFFYKYFVVFLNKFNPKLLVDDQFKKPQSFHETPISISGGTGIFFSFLILNLYLFFSKGIVYYEYLSFCSLFFILGLSDDLKLNLRPKFRLLAMLIILIGLVISNNFYVESTGIEFLNRFLEIDIFALFFVCLCFLFIINGSNLADKSRLLGYFPFTKAPFSCLCCESRIMSESLQLTNTLPICTRDRYVNSRSWFKCLRLVLGLSPLPKKVFILRG